MLPTASTRTRAWVVATLAIVTDSDPSLGVLAARTVGNVLPPSMDSRIRTLAVLTGAALVLATFQVMVAGPPPATVMLVFGDVTENGPAEVVDVTRVEAVAIAPPPARLSRAVTWNVIVRFVAGRVSPVRQVDPEQAYVCGGVLPLLRM